MVPFTILNPLFSQKKNQTFVIVRKFWSPSGGGRTAHADLFEAGQRRPFIHERQEGRVDVLRLFEGAGERLDRVQSARA